MKFYLLPIFIFSFYFIVNFGLSSQQVVIISAVNNNSSVVSIRTPEEAISVEGVLLGRSISPGSLILTGEGDSIELQILPSRSIIVISENTEFEISTLQGVNGADSSDFRVPIGKFYAEIKKPPVMTYIDLMNIL